MAQASSLGNSKPDHAALRIYTLGGFNVWRDGMLVERIAWGREKALHLFQFLITRRYRYLHKEQIIDQLWPELNQTNGDRDFKVSLNALNKALEPEREPRSQTRFIQRVNLAYGLNSDETWVDADEFEAKLLLGNHLLNTNPLSAMEHYREALALYKGDYMPDRSYEDWTSAERERLSMLALNGMTTLAGLEVDDNPNDSLRLTQGVLAVEPLWEDAYRTQMRAFMALGNRPMAIRTYQELCEVLEAELNIDPLPETQRIHQEIMLAGS